MIDLAIINGLDMSDYVLSEGINLSQNINANTMTDIVGNVHSAKISTKNSLSISFGPMPDSVLTKLINAVSPSYVPIRHPTGKGVETKTYVEVYVDYTAAMEVDGEIIWTDVELKGEES